MKGDRLAVVRNDPATAKPTERLWLLECGDRPSWLAASHWLSVRRGLWPSWAKLHAALGEAVLTRHIDQLMAEEPIGIVTSAFLREGSTSVAVELGELVETANGLRYDVLAQHRFANENDRTKFMGWFKGQLDTSWLADTLRLGLKSGSTAISTEIEDRLQAVA